MLLFQEEYNLGKDMYSKEKLYFRVIIERDNQIVDKWLFPGDRYNQFMGIIMEKYGVVKTKKEGKELDWAY